MHLFVADESLDSEFVQPSFLEGYLGHIFPMRVCVAPRLLRSRGESLLKPHSVPLVTCHRRSPSILVPSDVH